MANEKDTYQEKMNRLHAPESLVEKTLFAMNAELKKQEKSKARSFISKKRIAAFAAAAAACVALFLGFRPLLMKNGNMQFNEINTSNLLQISGTIRGDASQAQVKELEALFGVKLDTLVSGYGIVSANANQLRTPEKLFSSLKAEYSRDDSCRITVEIGDYMTPLYTVMSAFQPIKQSGIQLRFAKDTDHRALYAIWEKNGLYYTLISSDLTQAQFAELAKSIVAGQ